MRIQSVPRKKEKKEKPQTSLESLDSYERWLARQPVKPAKAKPGFISEGKERTE